MPTAVIQVKKSGPSKKYPDKFGWVLDTTGKFWNVTMAQALAAKAGQSYRVQFSTNSKGYEQVDGWTLASTGDMLEASVNGSGHISYKNGAEQGLDKKLEQQWAVVFFEALRDGATENQVVDWRLVAQKLAREAVMNQDAPQKPNVVPFPDIGSKDEEGEWLK